MNQTIRYLVSNTSLTRAIVRRHFSCNFLFIVSCDRDYQFFIGRIHLFILKRFQVCFRHLDREMAQCLADDADTHSCMKSQRSPCMAGYIEYKNKTQEKCNYCTIYQCISGFYKKNVELHLLLILAIDSVIYSFYVTILLCKKAPVFD